MPSPSSRRSTRAKPATAPPEYRQYRQTTRMLLVFARRALAHISPRFSIPAKTCEGIFAAALNDFAESHLEVWMIWRFHVVGGAASFAMLSRKVLIYLSLAKNGPAYSDARRLVTTLRTNRPISELRVRWARCAVAEVSPGTQ